MQILSLSHRPNGLPVFILVWVGQFISLLGSGLTEFALGVWASSIGQIVGVGPGRGIGFIFLFAGIANLCIIGIALAAPQIRRVEDVIPDGGG